MRLIDAHALHTAGYDVFERYAGKKDAREALREIEKLITTAPTVDAVEVVRCFYCRHWREPRSEKTIPWCNHLKTVMHASDFCNYGQRREDGDA